MATRESRLSEISKDTRIYKEFSVKAEAMDDRKIRFTITTTNPDRERDVVAAQGIDTAAFEANPVVLFAHDYKSLPVGRAVKLERHANKIVAVTEFATADLNPFAEQVYRMVKGGFLKAASIGFRPTKWVYNEQRKGVDFEEVELLEYSIVPVPANAQALVAARAAGIDVSILKDWARRIDDVANDDDDVVLTLSDDDEFDRPEPPPDRIIHARNDVRDYLGSLHEQERASAKYDVLRDCEATLTSWLQGFSASSQRSGRWAAPSRVVARQEEPVFFVDDADDEEVVFVDAHDLSKMVKDGMRVEVADAFATAFNRLKGRID